MHSGSVLRTCGVGGIDPHHRRCRLLLLLALGPSIYYVCSCREPSINDHLLEGEGSILEEILMFSYLQKEVIWGREGSKSQQMLVTSFMNVPCACVLVRFAITAAMFAFHITYYWLPSLSY